MDNIHINTEYDAIKVKPCDSVADKEKNKSSQKKQHEVVNKSLKDLNDKVGKIAENAVTEMHELDALFQELDVLIKTAILLEDSEIALGNIYKLLGRLERASTENDDINTVLNQKLTEFKQSLIVSQQSNLKDKLVNPSAVFPLYFSCLIKPKLSALAKFKTKKKFLAKLPDISSK